MAFPRKNTRRLTVDGNGYLWHLNRDWDCRNRWIVVQRTGCDGNQLLMVDPYHHDLLPTRGTITRAIRFGLAKGWHPEQKGPTIYLTFNEHRREFEVFASGRARLRGFAASIRLYRSTTIERAAQEYLIEGVEFGSRRDEWERLKAGMRPGDELRNIEGLLSRQRLGVELNRNGKRVATLLAPEVPSARSESRGEDG